MGSLSQLLPWLKGMLGSGPAMPTPTPSADPSQQIANLTGAQAGMGGMAPTGMGMTPPAPDPGQAMANMTGAEAGPTAMGPTQPMTPPTNPMPTYNLANYANVMKALKGIDTQGPENQMRGAPSFSTRSAGPVKLPGPQGSMARPSVGLAMASPAGRQLLMALKQMQMGDAAPEL